MRRGISRRSREGGVGAMRWCLVKGELWDAKEKECVEGFSCSSIGRCGTNQRFNVNQ